MCFPVAGKSYQLVAFQGGKGRGLSLDFLAVYMMKVKDRDEGLSSVLAAR